MTEQAGMSCRISIDLTARMVDEILIPEVACQIMIEGRQRAGPAYNRQAQHVDVV
jgi:hypothetical protein